MELKVNRAEWQGLSGDDRAKIESIVGSFFKGSTIVPDEATPASASIGALGVKEAICKAACTLAQAAASAACVPLGNPIAIAACIALAEAAGNKCRESC